MSIFNKLFGSGGSKEQQPKPGEAIQKLREVEEMLTKKSDFLEKKVGQETENARKHGMKNKRMALAALKRKKRYEKQLQQIDGTLSTLDYQREALENATTNTEVLKIMGYAAKAMKGAHQDMDVDKVHDLMDDVAEQQEVAQEISDAISNPVGFATDVDEDDLMKELEELEQEELDEKLLDIPAAAAAPTLPSVPEAELPAAAKQEKKRQEEEDDDMKELAQWAS